MIAALVYFVVGGSVLLGFFGCYALGFWRASIARQDELERRDALREFNREWYGGGQD